MVDPGEPPDRRQRVHRELCFAFGKAPLGGIESGREASGLVPLPPDAADRSEIDGPPVRYDFGAKYSTPGKSAAKRAEIHRCSSARTEHCAGAARRSADPCGSKDAVMIKTAFITAHRVSAAGAAN
jgi:hypothetical protein